MARPRRGSASHSADAAPEIRLWVLTRLAEMQLAPLAISIFGRWHKEIFADLAALLLGGPAVACVAPVRAARPRGGSPSRGHPGAEPPSMQGLTTRRVVVTGVGLRTPAGHDVDAFWATLLAGRRTLALVAQTLYPVEPEFPPRLLRKWLLEPTMSFPPGQLDRVLTFFAAHLPRFRMTLKADGVDVEEAAELNLDPGPAGAWPQIEAARRLCGRVTLAPTPPWAANSASAASKSSGAASIAMYSSGMRVCRENAAWMNGDSEWATGWPITA